MFKQVDDRSLLGDIEKEILEYWNKIDAFHRSLELNKDKPDFVFYDGPPFATGLPHYGHILAGTIKDVVTRYAHQTGHNVERRFGWDTHGLPVEHEVDSDLKITDRRQIEEMGIDVYNEKCRSIVLRYQAEWERIIGRTGRWIDFKNCYKTMDPSFMESEWWVFKQLWDKDLVYRGVKVMPYSTGCKTPLSNFEAGENYQKVSDPCLSVSFTVPGKDYRFVAWTTTPWTLPSNLALAVNPKLTYCRVVDNKTQKKYVLMKDRLCEIFNLKDKKSYTIEEEFLGKELVGIKYEPLFPYFKEWSDKGCFQVIDADYVSNEDGTGIVHIAPGFGEEDFNACMKKGLIKKGEKIVCPIDDNGCFTNEVTDYAGMYVKDADAKIIADLKANGHLVQTGKIVHSYPFCWRSDTPLIYRAVPSWFVRVEANREKLIENTRNTDWVPRSIRDGRFIEWLKGARDWAISRNRYWGTPIPIWTDDEYSEYVVVGSIAELEELSGVKGITDIHKHKIDNILIKSPKTGKMLHRIPEVFDCWFESGSMPFSQNHIPFSGKKFIQADFIAEGLDQTRGWFYTLTVLSTLLGYTSPFKHVIVNGLILAEDGKKMSKRLKNYPDPMKIMEEIGADSLRLYLVNSPAVHADPMRFKEAGVRQVTRDVMLPWLNSIKFFIQQVLRHGNNFKRNKKLAEESTNILDRWILSRLNRIIKFVHQEMKQYHLYSVLPELVKFIDEMTNWYVRLNRERLKSGKDYQTGIAVLYELLFNLSVLMAPFTPFFSEYSYQNLKPGLEDSEKVDSVHFLMLPQSNQDLIDTSIERQVGFMQSAIRIARAVRDKKRIQIRRPLKELIIVCSEKVKAAIEPLTNYITSEIHVLNISYDVNESKYVQFTAQADGKILGRKYGKKLKDINQALKQLSYDKMAELYNKSVQAQVNGEPAPQFDVLPDTPVTTEEINIMRAFVSPDEKKYAGGVDGEITAFCDLQVTDQILDISYAREIRNRIQQSRKKLGLQPTDKINIFVETDDEKLLEILKSENEAVKSALGIKYTIGNPSGEVIGEPIDEKIQIVNNEAPIKITITKQ
ncbi:isoleucine--tRNA ligase, cytoplasmic [Histomonas meleagridis]|uniref:isoleucine--tRNA ligase, cytoplasmic n=1 Tax=Histomonas meleagridis TaxID=135588 RepID=UPI0035596789|nr:isoleucine--tRNA ligase, cytoplasmic [Histomonas meleagridis]KAH0802205.1 isoleucine--tRNA ligase, cytoplasmic [Histomonas meleagridis]